MASKALGALATVGSEFRRALVRFAHEEAAQRDIQRAQNRARWILAALRRLK